MRTWVGICPRMTTVVCLLVLSCGGDSGDSSIPEAAVPEYELVIVDSIGVEIGDSTLMFGSISDLSYAPDGSIILLDRAFTRVMVYDGDGGFLRQIGCQGEGPGGMNLPVMMCLTGSGDIFVTQLDAMERYDYRTGDWVTEYPRSGGMPLPFVLAGMPDTTFIGVTMDILEEDDLILLEVTLGQYVPGSKEPLVEYFVNSFPFDPSNAAFMFEGLLDAYDVAAGEDGTLYIAARSGTDYRIERLGPGGEVLSEFSRDDIEPLEKTGEEISRESEFMEARLTSMDAAGLACTPDPLYPMIDDIGIGPDGLLWVRRGHPAVPTFDIYDDAWELTGTASLPIDPEVGRDWMVSVRPGGILAYSEDPPEGFQKVYMIEIQ